MKLEPALNSTYGTLEASGLYSYGLWKVDELNRAIRSHLGIVDGILAQTTRDEALQAVFPLLSSEARSQLSEVSDSSQCLLEHLGDKQGATDSPLLDESRHTVEQTLIKAHGNPLKSLTQLGSSSLATHSVPLFPLRRIHGAQPVTNEWLVKRLGCFSEFFGFHLPVWL